MAHIAYSNKDKGFYPTTRKDFDLGWIFRNEKGKIVGTQARTDLTPYEQVVVHHRARQLEEKRRLRPRKRLSK